MRPEKSLLPTILVSFALLFSSATIALSSATEFDVQVTISCDDDAALSTTIRPVFDEDNATNALLKAGVIEVDLDPVNNTASLYFDLDTIREADCEGTLAEDTGISVALAGEGLSIFSDSDYYTDCDPCDTSFDDVTVTLAPLNFVDFPADGAIYTGKIVIDLVSS